ncbi:(2Fe-2S)-binding protein [Hydrogenophaga crassostreae]|uniref:(2Fe-2S)-binding protein n=1 Tax=Hydrogenophaga crassostreae TaxID=1763535 RepID=A0A167HXI9_9BURK|nr:(2Fe-2S)-binding protein [Hydrogenophaga crassostreae]AOW13572.1 (2Fe-2S)-binding protein [Hydrogenophaga crassostreae]OAD41866.1 (2Fe-2S)-binding protein [Hydrogenophaga crassostreae]
MELTINGKSHPVPPLWQEESLLFFIREQLGLTGTKFGCGAGLCGACTVLLDGQAQRSCVLPVAQASGHEIRTIEGLAEPSGKLHPVQQAWITEAVPQCGYCQAGQIMSTVALLSEHRQPTQEQIDAALAGNLCRCGTQKRIRAAVTRAAGVQS